MSVHCGKCEQGQGQEPEEPEEPEKPVCMQRAIKEAGESFVAHAGERRKCQQDTMGMVNQGVRIRPEKRKLCIVLRRVQFVAKT